MKPTDAMQEFKERPYAVGAPLRTHPVVQNQRIIERPEPKCRKPAPADFQCRNEVIHAARSVKPLVMRVTRGLNRSTTNEGKSSVDRVGIQALHPNLWK